MSHVFLRTHAASLPFPIGLLLLLICFVPGVLPVVRYFLYRETVTGRVTELEIYVRGNKRSDRIVAEYTVDGSTYYVRSANRYAIPPYNVGDEIPLRVSRRNPAHAMMPCDLNESVKMTVLTGALFLLMLTAAILDAR